MLARGCLTASPAPWPATRASTRRRDSEDGEPATTSSGGTPFYPGIGVGDISPGGFLGSQNEQESMLLHGTDEGLRPRDYNPVEHVAARARPLPSLCARPADR